MFASSLEPLGAWRASRLPAARFVPLAALLGASAWIASSANVQHMVASILLAFSLVTQFRLWDDLVDRARDRDLHPGRVLSAAQSIETFVYVVLGLAVFNVIAIGLRSGGPALGGLLALNALVALWYWLYRRRDRVHAHVLLLKYPAFVALLTVPPVGLALLLAAAAAMYFAMCAFEALDDSTAPGSIRQRMFAVHACALATVPWVASQSASGAALSGMVAAALLLTWRHARNRRLASGLRFAPFVCLASILCWIYLRVSP